MKISFTLLLTTIALGLLAQPTLEFSNVGLSEGDVYTVHNITGELDEGDAGEDVIWDFSNLPNGTTTSSTVIAAADAPSGSSFPNANIAVTTGEVAYGFSSSTTTSFSFCGLYTGFYVAYYDDPEDYLRYPFSYNDDYEDTYHSIFNTGVEFERTGTVTVVADGWGTLIMPWGTVQNAMRIHLIEEAIDDSELLDLTYYSEVYMWYAPGYHGSLVSASSQSVNGGPATFLYSYSSEITTINTEINPGPTMQVFPNPATNEIKVQTQEGAEYIELSDATGKLIERTAVINPSVVMDVSELPGGVYLVTVCGREGKIVKQLIKS